MRRWRRALVLSDLYAKVAIINQALKHVFFLVAFTPLLRQNAQYISALPLSELFYF